MTARPRLVDVALRAGVSEKTVSNFVNGYPHMSPSTKEKVQAAISELGYRPNLSARSLGRGRTGFIAFAVPGLSNPYFAELAGRVIANASEHGWTVLIEETGGRKTSEDALVDSMPYLVDGVILHPESITAIDIASRSRDTPIVLIGERDLELVADHVVADNVAAAEEVTRHLLDGGRSRVATVGIRADAALMTSQLRFEGYRRALVSAGVPVDDGLCIPCDDFGRAVGAASAERILELGADAVLCFNAVVAAGLLSGLHSLGVDVPDSIAVAAFDDIEETGFTVPPLTTVAWDVDGIARSAVSLLAERHSEPGLPTREVSAGYSLVRRRSSESRA